MDSSSDTAAELPAWQRSGLVAWLGGLIIVAIVGLAVYDIVRGYRQTIARTDGELNTQARVIAEQTARSIQAVDLALRHLVEQHRAGKLAQLGRDELHLYLKEQAVGLVQIDGLVVFEPDGRVRAASLMPPAEMPPLVAAARSPFMRLKGGESGLMIDDAFKSPGNGQWVFPMGRRLETPAGEFAGAVGAAGRVAYFQQFYRDAYPEPGTRIALLRKSTSLLARHPPADDALGKQFPIMQRLLDEAAAGGPTLTRNASPLDGIDRFGAIREVPDYPLAVIVTRDADAVLAPWRAQAVGSVLRTLTLAALAGLLLLLTLRQLARLQAAHQSLAESRERFSVAVAGSDDGIWLWDFVNQRAFASARAREILGLAPAGEMQSIDDWFAAMEGQLHPGDRAHRRAAIDAHLAGETPAYEAEYRVRHRHSGSDEYRWIRVRGVCARDAQGRAVRMAGSVSDIDARKRAEAALRRSEERYQLAVEGANEGLWDWDLASDVLFLSARAQGILGLVPGETQRPRRDWIALMTYHPDDLPVVRKAIRDHLRGRTHHFAVEYRLRLSDGEWHWYRQRGIALHDAHGRAYRMAGSMENITGRKRAEAERDQLERQLRQAQKLEAIGTLAGGIAHDFNNILSAILGYGEMAQKDTPEGSALRRHVDASVAAGLRAKSLVQRILAFSRSGVGERVPVHVQSVVAEALEGIAASLPAGVRLERHLAAGDAGVLGDPTQIHQVVMNLCANAVQAMRSEGLLAVAVDTAEIEEPRPLSTSRLERGRYVRLTVKDSGCGIAPQVLERIFDPFFTTKEVGVGTGLGLSLVHGIVTDLGGGIDIASRVGEGSTFTVYLPWQGVVAPPAPSIEDVAPGSGETVLLVDDEETLVRLGEELLAELGYEPVGFTSAEAALAALREEPGRFDAVLSDEAMPGMTGSEFAQAIRRQGLALPIVLMSGFVSPALVQRAREAGVAEVLSKPLVARDIARSLAAALRPQAVAR
ncbi:PAS domain-containing protein [Caldimonas sp. KR1-144]|uniref:PAS domain-containing protein n=1 Tax=Caldimonas sp. KR1-144 TaxID=3400911 RepID=UPI003C03C904